MGTYRISNTEIMEVIEEALSNLEGDFTDKQLHDCLDVMKAYPYVSDKKKSGELIQVRKALFSCLNCNQEYVADEEDMKEEKPFKILKTRK